ncbi:oxaloacetate decarboxylase [Sinirhodobacter populi]|uniref:Oxaloacetate decarboxylase n=1 Tax=Paenirhodobacter populi TaxID=2306993 RepID=A0A443K4J4_9RHOB|nr:isocitrate lyase/phosphoenolpyruvate mutase family protein [Sinirhodobacter populi]RWR27689.1 oxaloacetate decarboxylase [Sinirhodobacter populi]
MAAYRDTLTAATSPRAALRALLQGDRAVSAASVFDPLSARSASLLGYEFGMLGGSVAAMVVLGAPDVALLTLGELTAQVRRITRASPDLPLLVDADHGYGNALNVHRTIADLEHAGAAGATVEDTELPAAFGSTGTGLISRAEGEGKIRAALAARRDGRFAVVGRTAAARITGIDDALDRAQAYQDSGADAVFLQGIRTREALEKVARRLLVPVILGGVAAEIDDPDLLASHGVRLLVRGHRPFEAAVEATHARHRVERAGSALPAELNGEELLARLRGDHDLADLAQRVLHPLRPAVDEPA